MNINHISVCFLTLLIQVSFIGFAQEKIDNSTRLKIVTAAKEIMNNAKTCALITLDKSGNARVRTMDPFPAKEDLIVWFGTNLHSRKVEQIKGNNKVTLYYLDKDATGYVTIHGEATLINDDSIKREYWKKAWENFYPNYPKGYTLIKVTPLWMEVISETRGILGDEKTWKPQKIYFRKEH
jgi:general stress protein 26